MQTSLTRIAFHHGAKITEITERTVTFRVMSDTAKDLEDELYAQGYEIMAKDIGPVEPGLGLSVVEIEVEDIE